MSTPPHQSPPPPSSPNFTHESNRELLSILSTPSSPTAPRRPALPQELTLQILSHPSRWVVAWSESIVNPTNVASTQGSRILLRTPPLTARSLRLLRQVVITIRSHDQGWSWDRSYHGTFEHSWTWFDVAVASQSAEAAPEAMDDTISRRAEMQDGDGSISLDSPNVRRHQIQHNRHGVKAAEDYRITLDRDHEIVNDLKVGDQILLVACAQFSGWMNTVEDAGMEIWAEDDLSEDSKCGN